MKLKLFKKKAKSVEFLFTKILNKIKTCNLKINQMQMNKMKMKILVNNKFKYCNLDRKFLVKIK